MRGRAALRGRFRAVASALAQQAAGAAAVTLAAIRIAPNGVHALVVAPSREAVRRFSRTLRTLCAARWGTGIRWRSKPRVRCYSAQTTPAWRRHLAGLIAPPVADRKSSSDAGREMVFDGAMRRPPSGRQAARLLRAIRSHNESVLGREDASARTRRHCAAHDAPADDRTAFERVCIVLFAAGIGFEATGRHSATLASAMCDFVPDALAVMNRDRIAVRLPMAVLRDPATIDACIASARRWRDLARTQGTYLGRIATLAATDDPASGWPALVRLVQADFPDLRGAAARMLLKRWGFFTARAHPGARRVLARLGLSGDDFSDAAVQLRLAALADRSGEDAYAFEAELALFAGLGACRPQPACSACSLEERCPFASGNRQTLGPATEIVPA